MGSLRAAGIGALLILASFSAAGQAAAHPSLAPRYHPGSMGLSIPQVGAASVPEPDYDEQIGATFVQDVPSLTYNVTALAQTGTGGYGPAYILNGLSSAGYWYQVGFSYDWPSTNGGYEPGFGFNYQVYGPSDRSVYPAQGSGLGTFSKPVDSGDTILLSLTFAGASVSMTAQDLETGAVAQASYSSLGASTFVGNPSGPANSAGYFTGVMTEWYRVGEYTGSEGKVTYTDDNFALTGAWLWADEFNAESSGAPVFDNSTDVNFANSQQLYPFETDGATIYGSAHEFITGLLNAASSTVTIKPASSATASEAFEASYTLAGSPQDSQVPAGVPSVIEADPQTSITVTLNSSSSSGLEKWVFSGTSGTSVTFAAGDNETYVYYELVAQTVSSAVAGLGAALPSSPVLTYDVPPPSAGAASTEAKATQPLTSEPATVMVLLGTTTIVAGNVTGSASGVRWATTTSSWTASAPDVITDPIVYYQQYQQTVEYLVAGGGTPPQVPQFTSTAFGSPVTVPVSGFTPTSSPPINPVWTLEGATQDWFDAGSSFSFTSLLNGTTSSERWVAGQPGTDTFPLDATVQDLDYTHQYYDDFGVNDPAGGAISAASGWFDAGSSVNASLRVYPGWQFEYWSGSGAGAYNGTSLTPNLTVTGAFNESATLYARLAVTAGAGDRVAYSYGSLSGSVSPGATDDLYVPPGSNVTLRASPSSLLYTFASWRGSSGNSTKPSLAVVVDSPETAAASSSYDYTVLLGIGVVVLVVLAGISLVIRSRRRRSELYGPWA